MFGRNKRDPEIRVGTRVLLKEHLYGTPLLKGEECRVERIAPNGYVVQSTNTTKSESYYIDFSLCRRPRLSYNSTINSTLLTK